MQKSLRRQLYKALRFTASGRGTAAKEILTRAVIAGIMKAGQGGKRGADQNLWRQQQPTHLILTRPEPGCVSLSHQVRAGLPVLPGGAVMRWTHRVRWWLAGRLIGLADHLMGHPPEATLQTADTLEAWTASPTTRDVDCPWCGRPVPVDGDRLRAHEYVRTERTAGFIAHKTSVICPCSGLTELAAWAEALRKTTGEVQA